MIITLANTKGGVGKTVSAIYLAEAFARQGQRARVVDMDPQGSASRWYDFAAASGDPAWTVENLTEYRLKQLVDSDRPTIIDCPPGDPRVIGIAVDLADLVVIPCKPSPDDYDRTQITYNMIPAGKAAVLVNDARLRTRALNDLLADLDHPEDDKGKPLEPFQRFETIVTHREHVVHANGTIPDKLNGFDDVLAEIEETIQ